MSNEFALRQYTLPLPQPFETSESLQDFGTPKPGAHHDESWPVLYILTNSRNKTAYIGQTTNYQRRMKQHAANVDKDFDRTLLIDNPLSTNPQRSSSKIDLLSFSVPTKNTRSPMPTTAMPSSIILSGLSIARSSETSGQSFAKKTTRFIRLKSSRTPICSSSHLSRRLRLTNTKRSRRFINVSNRSMKMQNMAAQKENV